MYRVAFVENVLLHDQNEEKKRKKCENFAVFGVFKSGSGGCRDRKLGFRISVTSHTRKKRNLLIQLKMYKVTGLLFIYILTFLSKKKMGFLERLNINSLPKAPNFPNTALYYIYPRI